MTRGDGSASVGFSILAVMSRGGEMADDGISELEELFFSISAVMSRGDGSAAVGFSILAVMSRGGEIADDGVSELEADDNVIADDGASELEADDNVVFLQVLGVHAQFLRP